MDRYANNKSLGRAGENRAVEYLDKKGYEILETNFRCKYGEVDIIAEDGEALCFIEVKTRRSALFGAPCLAVNRQKVIHIKRCAYVYLREFNYKSIENAKDRWSSLRVEIVEIIYSKEKFFVRHIKNI